MPKGIPDPPCEYIAGLNLNYGWSNIEKAMTIKMLKNGANIKDVTREFNREPIEIMILVDDLLKSKTIKPLRSIMKDVF